MSLYKKDKNHCDVMRVFQQFGFDCIDTSWSRGRLLDFIAVKRYGECWFVEVKDGKKKTTEMEDKFIRLHQRSVVIRSIEEAEKFCREVTLL